jgi:hypothetical protein
VALIFGAFVASEAFDASEAFVALDAFKEAKPPGRACPVMRYAAA